MFTGMYGNGLRIVTIAAIQVPLVTVQRGGLGIALSMWSVAVLGTMLPILCALPAATGSPPETGAIPSVFELPGLSNCLSHGLILCMEISS